MSGFAPANAQDWSYLQSTGELLLDGKHVGKGYSGKGEGLNNPAKEDVENLGPIPRGEWSIGPHFKHETKGPVVMRLTPIGHKAHDRSGFLIHGDNDKMNHTASNGCIILPAELRKSPKVVLPGWW